MTYDDEDEVTYPFILSESGDILLIATSDRVTQVWHRGHLVREFELCYTQAIQFVIDEYLVDES